MVVVSEFLQVSASEADTSIRAYDVDNGTVRWEDTVPNNGTRGFVESEGSVFAAVAIPSSNISSGTFVRSSSPGKRRDVAAAICSSAALTL